MARASAMTSSGAAAHEFLDEDDANAVGLGEVVVGGIVDRAADADLHDALGVEQALLDRPAERRAVGVGVVAEIAVVGVGVGVEMDEAERPPRAERPQDRQRDEVIAAGRERE